VLAAVLAGVFGLINAEIGPRPDSGPRPSGQPIPTSSSSCNPGVSLTSPANNAYIKDGTSGVKIKGVVCGLGSKSAWLFDWDSQDQYYYADYNSNTPSPLPLPTQGTWAFEDKPIGDSGDRQKEYILTLVVGSPACNQALLRSHSMINNQRVLHFPPGCQIVDKRVVYVSRP
jgi:hypothetical protein